LSQDAYIKRDDGSASAFSAGALPLHLM